MPGLMRRVALIGVLLAGCATTRAAEPEPIAWPAVPLATMGFPSTATQSVTVTRAGNTIDFTALIESDQTHLVVAGMGSMGPRLFKVTKTASGVTGEASPLVPSSFKPEHMLADLELAFASTESLRAAFAGTGWALGEKGFVRAASYDGTPVSTVTKTTDNPFDGPVDLENVRFGYHLHVETLEHE